MALKNNSEDRTITRGMLTVTLLVLLSSVARAGREMVIAYKYGVSAEVDAYLYVFNLVNWPIAIWFSVLTVVLVPLAARSRVESTIGLAKFRSELFGLSMLLGIIFTVANIWLLPEVLRASWMGLPASLASTALDIILPMSILPIFGILVGLFSVWTMAAGKHTNTLLEAVPSTTIMLAVIISPVHPSIVPLVVGTVFGFAIHAFALTIVLVKNNSIELPRLRMASPLWKLFFKGFGIMLAGQMLMSITTLIDQFFAGQLGDGNISTLNYANRILALLTGVGALAVSRTTLPLFSNQRQLTNHHVGKLARRWVWRLFGIGLGVGLLAWFTAPWVVKVFFERGAFSNQNTFEVVEVFRICIFQIPFYIAGIVLTSFFASQGRYSTIFLSSVLALTVKLAASYIFTDLWGLNGLPTSSALMYIATFLLLLYQLGRQTKIN